ncbi:MAG: hypothetical protein J1E58_00775 [Prevotella sp.]|nr:hypothetical protein [Prevotella sp.]
MLRVLKAGFAFNRLAKSLKEILDNLRLYQLNYDIDCLYKAAWIYKFGVADSLEKWNWSLYAKISIPDYQMLGRITLNEAIMIATSKIVKETNQLSERQQVYIDGIMEGNQAYNDVSHLLSLDIKDKLRP